MVGGNCFGRAPGCRAQSGHSIPRVATPGGDRTVIVPPRRRHPRASIALLPRTVRMSRSSHASDTSITGRDQLVGYVPSGEKPRAAWRIGTEHVKFGFSLEALRPSLDERRVGKECSTNWRPM